MWSREPAPEAIDIEQLIYQMNAEKVEPDSVYAAFARTGGFYGPSFKGISAIHHGNQQLVAHLRLPGLVQNTLGDYALHPSLMDSALQGYLGLVHGWFDDSQPGRMPFALESLRILSPCTPEMVAWMRYSPGSQSRDHLVRLDIDLCDMQGRVCAALKGFATREVPRKHDAPVGLVTLAPVWDVVKVDAGEAGPRAGARVMVIGGDAEQHRALQHECVAAELLIIDPRATMEGIAETLHVGPRIDHVVWILSPAKQRGGDSQRFIDAQEDGVLLGFRLIKALLREGYGAGELWWTVITNATQRIAGRPGENVDAAHSSVHGLVGSMAKEYQNWKVRLVDVAGEVWPWHQMLRLRRDERGEAWGYRDGEWYRRRLLPCVLADRERNAKACEYKRGGVYVLIGGAGGVGEVLSEY